MPDTGAPWNIPYVESSDLVSDWPADSLALANAIDAGLDAAGNAGIGTNVVSVASATYFATNSNTYTLVTGLELDFTPTSATSKVLVIVTIGSLRNVSTANAARLSLFRDGTDLKTATFGFVEYFESNDYLPASLSFLDSPATTSSVNYEVRALTSNTSTQTQVNGPTPGRAQSTITAIEVAV